LRVRSIEHSERNWASPAGADPVSQNGLIEFNGVDSEPDVSAERLELEQFVVGAVNCQTSSPGSEKEAVGGRNRFFQSACRTNPMGNLIESMGRVAGKIGVSETPFVSLRFCKPSMAMFDRFRENRLNDPNSALNRW
jgi:hypothetical protein